MPTIELHVFDHLIFIVLTVVFPLYGRHRFLALRSAAASGQRDARIRAYRVVLIEEWSSTAVVAVGWLALARSAESLGLLPEFDLPALIGYGVTTLIVAFLLFQARTVATSEEAREKVRASLGKLLDLIPHDSREQSLFRYVAMTAGICEEFLYRGFLFAYLASWLPSDSAWLVVLIGGLLFGIAHLYQGGMGILKTGALGVLMGLLYWATGSIWASVVLHAAIDLNSGWIGWRVLQDRQEGDLSAPAPA